MIPWIRSLPTTIPEPPDREWMLWIGDGIAPAGPDLIGRPVDFNGRKGKVIDVTALKVLIEWEKPL